MFRDLLNLVKPGWGTPIDERRETVRLRCRFPVQAQAGKRNFEVIVLNASLTGLCLETDRKLRTKQQLVLHYGELGGSVTVKVAWCRALKGSSKFESGVLYCSDKEELKDSWIKPALKKMGFKPGRIGEKRKLLRVQGSYRCLLKSMAGDVYTDAEVLNLSIGGMQVEGGVELPLKLKIRVKTDPWKSLDPLEVVAEVRTCRRNPKTRRWTCGLAFLEADEGQVKRHMSAFMDEL